MGRLRLKSLSLARTVELSIMIYDNILTSKESLFPKLDDLTRQSEKRLILKRIFITVLIARVPFLF
jgi:hypothetical protein